MRRSVGVTLSAVGSAFTILCCAMVVSPMRKGAVVSLPIIFVILWFLIAEKQAFGSAAQELAHEPS